MIFVNYICLTFHQIRLFAHYNIDGLRIGIFEIASQCEFFENPRSLSADMSGARVYVNTL